jgi:sucrose-6-phosphate hydrolase SacC (GH32 family)
MVSHDHGRTWTAFAGNPVLKTITPRNRDTLVFWHDPSQRWVMVLYVGYPVSNPGNRYTAQIFNSTNLTDWTYESRIEGFFDCPMLFELPLDGQAAEPRWIIHCANMRYQVGRFDGKVFTPETPLIDSHPGKSGESEYAPQVFRNAPDGRTVQLGWLHSNRPGMRQVMTFPDELALVSTPAGPRLRWQPVPEIEKLYGAVHRARNLPLNADAAPAVRARGRHLDIQADIAPGQAREVELNVRGIAIVLHPREHTLTVRGYTLPVALADGRLRLRVLLDETSIELFADDGLVYLPLVISDFGETEAVTLAARGGSARAERLDIAEINPMWATGGEASLAAALSASENPSAKLLTAP